MSKSGFKQKYVSYNTTASKRYKKRPLQRRPGNQFNLNFIGTL
jgi:hypothetical protein